MQDHGKLLTQATRDVRLPDEVTTELLDEWDQLEPCTQAYRMLTQLKMEGFKPDVLVNASRDKGLRATTCLKGSADWGPRLGV